MFSEMGWRENLFHCSGIQKERVLFEFSVLSGIIIGFIKYLVDGERNDRSPRSVIHIRFILAPLTRYIHLYVCYIHPIRFSHTDLEPPSERARKKKIEKHATHRNDAQRRSCGYIGTPSDCKAET